MRFDDDGYLREYYATGKFPKIHDDIFAIGSRVSMTNALDIGCCFGLLSARFAQICNLVIGIDSNETYINKAVKRPNVRYEKLGINKENMQALKKLIVDNGIDTVIARRIIPEVYETGGFELCEQLAFSLHQSGIRSIIIEGRKSNRNAVNPLYDLPHEIAVFGNYYCQTDLYKNCAVLERK